jgi:UDP-N-acetylmuramoylalanine--D-glutamate ligase
MIAAAKKKRASRKKTAKKKQMDLVFGLGATGLSVARFLQRKQIAATFVDSRAEPPGLAELSDISPDAEIVLGAVSDKLLKNTARIIVSPGIADSEPLLCAARERDVEIISDIELFARDAKAPFVAVTGSNGKSTVTTLLSLMCDAAGITGVAGANLGVPALDLLDGDEPDFFILELSSFQLQRTLDLPAKIAVLLNISPDHLDWHESDQQYRDAKYRIFAQAESAVINRADDEVEKHLAKELPRISFGLDVPDAGQYGVVEDEGEWFLARGDQLLLSSADIAMVGKHNQANALAALATGELMGLPLSAMLQVLNEFPGLPHRMQYVGHKGRADFINDSKATNVGAAIASIDSIDGFVVLIAGGQGKGGDFAELAKAIFGKLRVAILIGEDAPLLEEAFVDLAPSERASDMRAAVNRAAELAVEGDTVLLAPACASFDQYANYQQRGEDFCQAVEDLAL